MKRSSDRSGVAVRDRKFPYWWILIDRVRAVAVSGNGSMIVSGGADQTVRVWEVKEAHIGRVTGVAISPNGRLAATCADDKTLKLWNLPDLGR